MPVPGGQRYGERPATRSENSVPQIAHPLFMTEIPKRSVDVTPPGIHRYGNNFFY